MIKPSAHLVAPFLLAPSIAFAQPVTCAASATELDCKRGDGRGFSINLKSGGRVH